MADTSYEIREVMPMRRLALVASFMVILAACGGSSGDKSSADERGVATGRDALASREEDLRAAFEETIGSFLDGDTDAFYARFSSDFQERCELKDFRALLALATVFIGDLSDKEANIEITNVRFDDDRAYVTATVDVEGVDIDEGGDEGNLSDFWVLEDGEWKADTDDEAPCDLGDGIFGGSTVTPDDDDDEPAGPGESRRQAVALGDTVTTGDMSITVVGVNLDAAGELTAEDDFVDPPAEGNRYVLVTVRVEHVGEGEETISVSASDYELTGSNNVVYDTFDEDSRCGFFSGEISGEMFPGGVVEGDVCFQVPAGETGLILIASPFVSFDDDDKRYLKLD